jgi:hypothetical protein
MIAKRLVTFIAGRDHAASRDELSKSFSGNSRRHNERLEDICILIAILNLRMKNLDACKERNARVHRMPRRLSIEEFLLRGILLSALGYAFNREDFIRVITSRRCGRSKGSPFGQN